VPGIRATLVELQAGARRVPKRDPDALRSALRQATHLRNAMDYAALAPLLPALLLD
jgi:hypothetical protein